LTGLNGFVFRHLAGGSYNKNQKEFFTKRYYAIHNLLINPILK